MALLDPISNYCERTGPGLWDEPLNAVSNLSFFIAAWVLYRTYRKRGQSDPQALALIALLFLIGCGSTLFHVFANGLTELADVLPITLFTFVYLWTVLRRFVALPQQKTALALVAFAAFGALTSHVPAQWRFNGSISYFPCLFALFIIGAVLWKRERAAASTIVRAACWFATSILYRSLDMKLCAHIPIGTHFLWHIMNGWLLYLLVSALMPRKTAVAD